MYSSRITRTERAAILILCDRSGSMAERIRFLGEDMPKSEAVAVILDMLVDETVNRSRREDGLRDYFDIAVLGYSGCGVQSLLSPEGGFASLGELYRRDIPFCTHHVPRTLPDGRTVTSVIRHRRWIEPLASGDTPMCAALEEAARMTAAWCARRANRRSFPPVVINITDGEASDADPEMLLRAAARIRGCSTADGNALLLNIHLAGRAGCAPVSFPGSGDELPQVRYAELLARMSSVLPECYDPLIVASRPDAVPPFRAVGYDCPVDELFAMLTIGTAGSVLG